MVSWFIWFICHGLSIESPSTVSFQNEPFDSRRPSAKSRQILCGYDRCDANNDNTLQWSTYIRTHTRDTIPTQSRSQSIPLNQIVRNGNTVQIVLIYSFQEKFRTGASDKIETHRPSYIIQRNQTALSAWWKISEKLSITMRTTMIELRLTPSSFNVFYLR